MYLNKAFIIGNLTRDPELRSLPSGASVTSFSLATNRVWKNQDGEKQESTEFHNVVVFGRQAETTSQYLKKGDSALVEGRLQTRSWESDGQKKYRTEIVADRVQFGPKGGGSRGGGYDQDAGSSEGAGASNTNTGGGNNAGGGKSDSIDYPQEEINPDDIPF